MSAKSIGQRQWVQGILRNLRELEEQKPNVVGDTSEWPEWVINLMRILMAISYPGVNLKTITKWKAKDLGRFLGRRYAGEHLVRGGVPLSAQVMQEGERLTAWAEARARETFPAVDLDEVQKQVEQGMKVWKPKFNKFMQETLSSACERPYNESSAFFEAFGKAIVSKPDDYLTERTMGVGDKICWTMLMRWQGIARLRSVAELHRAFEQALKPQGITVRFKRIEKLCQRIGLKFREPGRPPGKTIQTNPTSV